MYKTIPLESPAHADSKYVNFIKIGPPEAEIWAIVCAENGWKWYKIDMLAKIQAEIQAIVCAENGQWNVPWDWSYLYSLKKPLDQNFDLWIFIWCTVALWWNCNLLNFPLKGYRSHWILKPS